MKLLVPLVLGTTLITTTLFQPASAGLRPRNYDKNIKSRKPNWGKSFGREKNTKVIDARAQKKILRKYGEKLVSQGDVVMTEDQLKKRLQKANTDGPESRTFTKPKRIWNQYAKEGRYRIALKVDVNSFRSDELEHMKNDLPKSVKDFREKTGLWFDLHCDDRSRFGDLGDILNDNRNDKDWCHDHWMTLTSSSNQGLGGCSSYLGRQGRDWQGNGEQQISLQVGCAYKNTISHEIIHALGWTHEQNRADRDDVIYVDFRYISPAMAYNFKREVNADNSGSPYDLLSVMQYHDQAFTTNWNHKTMTARNRGDHVITSQESFERTGEFQNRGLSEWDSYEINYQYSLQQHCADRGMKWSLYSTNDGRPKKGAKMKQGRSGRTEHDTCTRKNQRLDICKTCQNDEYCAELKNEPYNECRPREDPCDNNPCVNKGRCKSDMSDTSLNPAPYVCTCNREYFGDHCEDKVECKAKIPMVFDNKQTVTKICPSASANIYNSRTQTISISGRGDIWGLGKHIFIADKFKNVKTVEANHAKIKELQVNTFNDLPNLEHLQMQDNKLVKLPDNVFRKNNKLKILNLSNNRLETFPTKAVKSSMKELYLQGNTDLEISEKLFDSMNGATKLFVFDIGNSPNELKNMCRNMKDGGKISSNGQCCYAVKFGLFGEKEPMCL